VRFVPVGLTVEDVATVASKAGELARAAASLRCTVEDDRRKRRVTRNGGSAVITTSIPVARHP
jgi:hypothetical protein